MIDEKKLIEKLFNLRWDFVRDDLQLQWNRAIDKVVHVIQDQPTIHQQGIDKDRLIEELEKIKFTAFLTLANSGNEALDKAWEYSSTYLDIAIETVKRGGQND